MIITLADAKLIRDAFGSCTTVGECFELSEIQAEIEEIGSVRVWVKDSLRLEGITSERWMDAACEEEASGEERFAGKHAAVIKEADESMRRIVERTAKLMKEKGW